MNDHSNKHIDLKLFIGCLLTAELRAQIYQSKKKDPQEHLREVRFQHKDYIGHYLPFHTINLEQLHHAQNQLMSDLQTSYPGLSTESLKISVFSQLFLS